MKEVIAFYTLKISEIDSKYFGTQDINKNLISYKKRHWADVKMKEMLEDFIEDLNRLKIKQIL